MGKHISTVTYPGSSQSRWEEMSGVSAADCRFYEYGTTGAGAITSAVTGGKILSASEAAKYTLTNIFGKNNGQVTFATAWNPNSTEVEEDPNTYYVFNGASVATGTCYVYNQSLNGSTGTLGNMTIDATSGKVVARDSDTQINAGGKLTFTVAAGTTITITNHSGYHGYTINGVAATSDSYTVTFNTATTVEFVATETVYLWTITVIPA